jgi:hypothetical protein
MIDNVHEKQKILIETLHENGVSLVGFGDVSFLENELTKKFPVAVSLGVKYEEKDGSVTNFAETSIM